MALKIWNESALLKALFAGKPGNPMTTGQAAAFDTAFPNNVALKWSNAAGTAEVEAIKVNASDAVELGAGSALVVVGDTGTATSTASAGTVSKQSGTVTSEALTTAAGAAWTLTLTNTKIAATSKVFASVENGTNTQGIPVIGTATAGSGSAVIKVYNLHASQALNGTIKVKFFVVP